MWERTRKWITNLEMTKDELKQIKLVLLGATGLGIILLMVDNQDFGGYLLRNTYERGERIETLIVEIEASGKPKEIDVAISEQVYTEEQIVQLKDEAWEKVLEALQDEQVSLDHMEGTINLPNKVEGYPFDIK